MILNKKVGNVRALVFVSCVISLDLNRIVLNVYTMLKNLDNSHAVVSLR